MRAEKLRTERVERTARSARFRAWKRAYICINCRRKVCGNAKSGLYRELTIESCAPGVPVNLQQNFQKSQNKPMELLEIR